MTAPAAGWVRRILVLVGFAVVGVVAGRVVVLALDEPPTAAPGVSAAPTAQQGPGTTSMAARGAGACRARPAVKAAAVLRTWDADRAAAYARGDAGALRRLYLDGSRAGARDLVVLRAYAARGLVVRGMRTQLLSLCVVDAADDRLRLEVTDRRVGGAAAVRMEGRGARPRGPRGRVALPQDAPSARVLELVRTRQRWRVASVASR